MDSIDAMPDVHNKNKCPLEILHDETMYKTVILDKITVHSAIVSIKDEDSIYLKFLLNSSDEKSKFGFCHSFSA